MPACQVTGAFGGLISLMMTPHQAESSRCSLAAHCSNVWRSYRAEKNPPQQQGGSDNRKEISDKTEAVKAMLLNKVLETNSGLTGKGIKIGESQ